MTQCGIVLLCPRRPAAATPQPCSQPGRGGVRMPTANPHIPATSRSAGATGKWRTCRTAGGASATRNRCMALRPRSTSFGMRSAQASSPTPRGGRSTQAAIRKQWSMTCASVCSRHTTRRRKRTTSATAPAAGMSSPPSSTTWPRWTTSTASDRTSGSCRLAPSAPPYTQWYARQTCVLSTVTGCPTRCAPSWTSAAAASTTPSLTGGSAWRASTPPSP